MMKKPIVLLLFCATMGVLTGCELSGDDPEVCFYNQSTHVISIKPNGEPFWDAFELAPGQTHCIGTGRQVYFLFQPWDGVEVANNEKGNITFIDIIDGTVEVN